MQVSTRVGLCFWCGSLDTLLVTYEHTNCRNCTSKRPSHVKKSRRSAAQILSLVCVCVVLATRPISRVDRLRYAAVNQMCLSVFDGLSVCACVCWTHCLLRLTRLCCSVTRWCSRSWRPSSWCCSAAMVCGSPLLASSLRAAPCSSSPWSRSCRSSSAICSRRSCVHSERSHMSPYESGTAQDGPANRQQQSMVQL